MFAAVAVTVYVRFDGIGFIYLLLTLYRRENARNQSDLNVHIKLAEFYLLH